MTGAEILAVSALTTAAGGVVIGVLKIVAVLSKGQKSKSDPPPANHGPCNDAVNRLTDALHEEIAEQRAFRMSFEKWMAEEAGYRKGLRATGEFPVPSG